MSLTILVFSQRIRGFLMIQINALLQLTALAFVLISFGFVDIFSRSQGATVLENKNHSKQLNQLTFSRKDSLPVGKINLDAFTVAQEIQWPPPPPVNSTEPYELIWGPSTGPYIRIFGPNRLEVSLKNTSSGEIVRTFEAAPNSEIVRVFVLDEGRTVALSQASPIQTSYDYQPQDEFTIFFDVETGQEIARIPQRTYGFSSDESLIVVHKLGEGSFVYTYPDFKLACQIQLPGFPIGVVFSENNKFLNVVFSGVEPDFYGAISSFPPFSYIFDLERCQEIAEFSRLVTNTTVAFDSDSKFAYFRSYCLGCSLSAEDEENLMNGTLKFDDLIWRFNLLTHQIEKIAP